MANTPRKQKVRDCTVFKLCFLLSAIVFLINMSANGIESHGNGIIEIAIIYEASSSYTNSVVSFMVSSYSNKVEYPTYYDLNSTFIPKKFKIRPH
jgi:hypothetical protein